MRPYPPDMSYEEWRRWEAAREAEQREWAACEAAFAAAGRDYAIEAQFLHLPSVRQAISRQADWLLNHCHACGCETEAATCPACGADLSCPF